MIEAWFSSSEMIASSAVVGVVRTAAFAFHALT
jgi:hypothetical protein